MQKKAIKHTLLITIPSLTTKTCRSLCLSPAFSMSIPACCTGLI